MNTKKAAAFLPKSTNLEEEEKRLVAEAEMLELSLMESIFHVALGKKMWEVRQEEKFHS